MPIVITWDLYFYMLLYDRDRFVKQALWIFCVCWICQTVNTGYDTRLCSVGLSNVLYYAFIISGLARMFNPADKTTCHLRPISLWRASSNTGSPYTPLPHPAPAHTYPLHPYPLSPQKPHQQLSGLHRTPYYFFVFGSVCVCPQWSIRVLKTCPMLAAWTSIRHLYTLIPGY